MPGVVHNPFVAAPAQVNRCGSGQFADQLGERERQIGAACVDRAQERDLAADAGERHLRQRLLQPGTGGDRHPGADEQAEAGPVQRLDQFRMPHTARYAAESGVGVVVDILGVRSHADRGIEHRGQLCQFAARTIARDLIAADDHHLADGPGGLQGMHNPPQALDIAAISARGRDEGRRDEFGLLNILGQQQHRRTAALGGMDGAGEVSGQVGGCFDAGAVVRDRREQPHRVEGAGLPARVLEGALALQNGRWLPDQREHGYAGGEGFGQSGDQIHGPAAGGGRDQAEAGGGAGVAVCHGGGGEFVLGDHGGDQLAMIESRVVEILDIRAVDAEYMPHAQLGDGFDQVIHHACACVHGGGSLRCLTPDSRVCTRGYECERLPVQFDGRRESS